MFKKLLITIIGLILILSVSFIIIHKASSAAPASKDNTAIKICDVDGLNTYLTETAKADLEKVMGESDGDENVLKIRVAFEKARTEYHDTVKCVFDVATIQILGSAGGVGENIKKDDLPDLTQALQDINKPDKVCPLVDNGKLNSIIEGDNPATLVPPLLTAYNNYSALINYFLDTLKNKGSGSKGSFTTLPDAMAQYQPMKLLIENEVQDSIMALDSAFETLKELRISFVMHVRFECMIKNLELYRRLMANLRSIVTVMPSVIENASMHK